MFLLFLPFCILLNLPSSLPSLQVPSTWQTPARKPGCIHNSSSKHQLIIRPAITHLPPHLSLISDRVTLFFLFHSQSRSACDRGYCELRAMQSNLLLLYIFAGLELCFDQRDDGAGVLVQLHVSEKPHSLHRNLQAWQRAVVSDSLFCSTPNWGNLLS